MDYDFTIVSGDPIYQDTLQLAGTLNIAFADDFTPEDGDIFYLLSGSVMEELEARLNNPLQYSVFNSINVSGLDLDKFEYQIDYITTLLTGNNSGYPAKYNLTVALKVLAVVPEPSNVAMLGFGLALIGGLVRRHRQSLA
ncbi:PEP-CTERM sorting domain-containing protein [Methylobacillus glycogenes]|uniref:PEP-CTERM sorting domain-containing protein n=1 Tax=Methylobacillus glycogenes TaxID=406 RepID=UPI00046FD962|nr:PEP-CTERM sorting domain-containing protein [Methylobacillus glycogenes]